MIGDPPDLIDLASRKAMAWALGNYLNNAWPTPSSSMIAGAGPVTDLSSGPTAAATHQRSACPSPAQVTAVKIPEVMRPLYLLGWISGQAHRRC